MKFRTETDGENWCDEFAGEKEKRKTKDEMVGLLDCVEEDK